MARPSNQSIIQIVNDHRWRARQAEFAWKERFYEWEVMYNMKYLKTDLATRDEDVQTRSLRSKLFIGYAHAQIETAVAKVLNDTNQKWPPFEVDPEAGRTEEQARNIQALHAHSLKKNRWRKLQRQGLRFLFIYGIVAWKHLWHEDWLNIGERIADPVALDENGAIVWEFRTVQKARLVYEGPKTFIVDPYTFHLDPMAESVQTARWVQEEFVRSGDHIKNLIKRGVYNQIDWDLVEPATLRGENENYRRRRQQINQMPSADQRDAKKDKITPGMYEIIEEWRNDRVITVMGKPGGKQQMLRNKPNRFHHGMKPYTSWSYLDTANEFWAMSMMRELEGVQSELNLIRRLRADALTSNLRRMWRVSPGAKKKINKKQLEWRPDGIVYANKDELEPLPVTGLDIFSYKEEQIIREDGDRLTGINETVRGQAPASTTATVGTLNAGFATDRLSLIEDAVSDGNEEMLEMRHALYKQFSTRDFTVKAIGRGGIQSVRVSLEDIRGQYGFRFISGRGLGQTEINRTHLMNMLTITSQNPMAAQHTRFVNVLTDIWATFPGVDDPSRYVIDETQPEIPQQVEIQIMEQGVPMLPRPNDNHIQHAEVLQQYMASEQFASQPQNVQEIVQQHAAQHQPYVEAIESSQGTQGPSGSPDRAQIPGRATTDADVLKVINRQLAPSVSTT